MEKGFKKYLWISDFPVRTEMAQKAMAAVLIATTTLSIRPIANQQKALPNNWKKEFRFSTKNTNHKNISLIFKHIQIRILILNHLKRCTMKP